MLINEEKLKLLKEIELDILIQFDKVCSELGINYSLSSGTLLGAVRHQGYIPWDDDIDVMMPRDDYKRFIMEGQTLLPSNLFIQTYESDKKYPLNFGKIRDTETELKEYSTKSIKMKTGVYIDIFPVDKISSKKIIRKIDNYLITIILSLKYSCTLEWAFKSSSIIRKMVRLSFYPISNIIGTRLLNKIETMIRVKNNKNGNKLTYGDRYTMPQYKLKDSMIMNFDIFTQYQPVTFEKKSFKSIKDKEKYLSIIYGNYMKLPPEEERIPRHDFIEIDLNNNVKDDKECMQ